MYGPTPEIEWSQTYKTPTSKKQALRTLLRFCDFAKKTPTQLLELQAKGMTSQNPDEQYAVLDLLEKWIESLKGRRSSKIGRLSTVRQFFESKNRPLPPTKKNWLKKIKSDTPAVEGKLTPERLRAIVASLSGDPRKLSMVLAQLQSFSGPRELCLIANTMGVEIGEQIKNGANIIEIKFLFGRKHSENPWVTYIGKDACEALRKWFAIRGYPSKGDPLIWPCKTWKDKKMELTETNWAGMFADIMARLGYRDKTRRKEGEAKKSSDVRWGVSAKELRDLAASIAQTQVGKQNDKGEAFLESSIEYFLGHSVDPLHYRKMHELDVEFRTRQYQIIEPSLNVVSNPSGNNGVKKAELDEVWTILLEKELVGESKEGFTRRVKDELAMRLEAKSRVGGTHFMDALAFEGPNLIETLGNPNADLKEQYRALIRVKELLKGT